MLNHDEIMDGLRKKAERFQEAYRKKEYLSAMWIYNEALHIAVFMSLTEEDMKELFGNRSYIEDNREELKDGLFKEEHVECARLWCIRNNCTRQQVTDTDARLRA
ncbi:MAG: hypothetical protein E7290_09405 [Lachnospiraceae bacterium]|nr:hypothetical protein [Lachnospiraceae bacterium]